MHFWIVYFSLQKLVQLDKYSHYVLCLFRAEGVRKIADYTVKLSFTFFAYSKFSYEIIKKKIRKKRIFFKILIFSKFFSISKKSKYLISKISNKNFEIFRKIIILNFSKFDFKLFKTLFRNKQNSYILIFSKYQPKSYSINFTFPIFLKFSKFYFENEM